MTAKLKIRLDSIEKAHEALEALPQHEPTEVTKTQAIQKLIGPIRASQSKGYSLAAIGKVLSECGIPIATGVAHAVGPGGSARAGARRGCAVCYHRDARWLPDAECRAPGGVRAQWSTARTPG